MGVAIAGHRNNSETNLKIKRTMSEHDSKGEKIQEFNAHQSCISRCLLIHNDSTIVTASHDTKIVLWNASTGGENHELCGHQHSVVDCRILGSDEDRLLSVSWDKTARLWDIDSGKQLWLGNHESLATTCDFCVAQPSCDSTVVIVGLEDGHYCIWDTRIKKPVKTVKAHSNTVTCCRVSPNGMNVCTCSMDQTAAVWDIRSNSRLLNLSGHINVVSSCAFSHNSHLLATCSWDKTLQVYDVATGSYRANGPVALLHHDGCVSACDFSKDSSLLVSCGYDMQVNVWNMNNYQLKNTYKGHEAWIKDVKFGENKAWVVSCDKSGMVRIWNTEAGSQHYNRMVKLKDPNTVELIKCTKCKKIFSPAFNSQLLPTATVMEGGEGGIESNDTDNGDNYPRDISSAEQQQQLQLCVFCRLRDPSQTLDQVSDHFLQQ